MKKTKPLSVKQISEIANLIRKLFGVPSYKPFPIKEILDHLFEEGVLSIQYLEDENPIFDKDTQAKYSPIDNFIYIKESLLDSKSKSINFTLCHEFFHFLQFMVFDFTVEETENCKKYYDPEWQANEFAGALLIPNEEVYKKYTLKDLAKRYNVTNSCALTRLTLHKLRQKRKK